MKTLTKIAAILAALTSGQAFATCGWQLQGIHTRWVCVEDNVSTLSDNNQGAGIQITTHIVPATLHAYICNETGSKLFLDFAVRTANDTKLTWGWYGLESGSCQTFQDERWGNEGILYVRSQSGSFPNYNTNDTNDNATFCQDDSERHNATGVGVCHSHTSGFSFQPYGRVSRLPRFTFR